ncbi:MAG: CRTAC1 family protein [Burkholderiales bacterium]|nr:MAG: CRTAC1 family protein [Burkholderiales bacterium]
MATAQTSNLIVPRFIEETDSAGLQLRFEGESEYLVGGGVAAFDCDGDGLPDLYLTGGVNRAKFYRNVSTRGGALKLREERSGLEVTNAVGAYPMDVDGDGNTDVVVLRVGEMQIYRGLGGCKFERTNDAWGFKTGNQWHTAFAATWERGQNWPTLAIGTYTDRAKPEFPWGSCTQTWLMRPNAALGGKGFAAAQALTPGHCALSMLFSDWARNGYPDLRVSNDREYFKGGQEQLWKLRPGQAPSLYTAAEGWKPLQLWGMGIASHDVDGDGKPELYLTSMSDNKLQKLDADAAGAVGQAASRPSYSDMAFKRNATAHRPYAGGDVQPSTAWHAQFADVNHDGSADLFVVKGNVGHMPDFAALDPNNLMLQKPDGTFEEVGLQAGVASVHRGRGGLLIDMNADGMLDMVVVNRWEKAQLWRNVGTGTEQQPRLPGSWLQLRLKQSGANRDAIGAWVEVETRHGSNVRVVRQELTVGGGHASGHLGWMHFGLGTEVPSQVRVRVQWPALALDAQPQWSDWMTASSNQFVLVERTRGLQAWKAP